MALFIDSAREYRLLGHYDDFEVVAVEGYEDEDGNEVEILRPVGRLECLWDGTYRAWHGPGGPIRMGGFLSPAELRTAVGPDVDDDAPRVRLGRVTSTDEGLLLVQRYRQAGMLRRYAETWGRNDSIHLRVGELGVGRS